MARRVDFHVVSYHAMDVGDPATDPTRKDLILASAFFHAPPPRAGERHRANCSRVLRHALMAAGLWEEGMSTAFYGEEDGSIEFRVVKAWYETLIELTRQEHETDRLLEGGGNLGDPAAGSAPAGAYFTACWLTPAGRAAAERILVERPELEARLWTKDR